jgi:hypothetical protein
LANDNWSLQDEEPTARVNGRGRPLASINRNSGKRWAK